MYRCQSCGQQIDGPVVKVGRRNDAAVEVWYLHMTCFEEKYQEFKAWHAELPEGFTIPTKETPLEDTPKLAERDTAQTREEKAEQYKQTAMRYLAQAQKAKDGDVWMTVVNDPGCYHAVRNILSLKGLDMSVEQFEEIAAVLLVVMDEAKLTLLHRRRDQEIA